MSVSDFPRARTSASFVQTPTEDVLTADRVLRMFDETRKELAIHVAGCEGNGAGYDGLRVDWSALTQVVPGDTVTVTAVVSSLQPRRHLVDYIATASNNRGRRAVLAQAHGWTLVPDGPQQRGFRAQSPKTGAVSPRVAPSA